MATTEAAPRVDTRTRAGKAHRTKLLVQACLLRATKGLTNAEIAERIGVAPSTVGAYLWEGGYAHTPTRRQQEIREEARRNAEEQRPRAASKRHRHRKRQEPRFPWRREAAERAVPRRQHRCDECGTRYRQSAREPLCGLCREELDAPVDLRPVTLEDVDTLVDALWREAQAA